MSGQRVDNAWGNQIRSYVLAPYQLVKDLRSGYETGNVDAVLDGDLDAFMETELRRRARGRGGVEPAVIMTRPLRRVIARDRVTCTAADDHHRVGGPSRIDRVRRPTGSPPLSS